MSGSLDIREAEALVLALLLRVRRSSVGNVMIDELEAEAVRLLLQNAEDVDPAWREDLPDFSDAVRDLRPGISSDTDVADRDGDEEEDEEGAGVDIPAMGTVGNGSYDGSIDLDFTAYNEAGSTEAILCVDFGTALTKAFATRGWNEAYELPIGRIAGGEHPFMVESSIWIEDETIYFGPVAVKRSEEAEEGLRFDSMKTHLMRLAAGAEGEPEWVDDEINPNAGKEDFSVLGLMTLYLAYVDQLVVSALRDKGLPEYLKRRIARPCWTGEQGEMASRLLKILIAKSIVVSHTLGSDLLEGIDVAAAAEVLDAVDAQLDEDELEELVQNTIETDIAEPEAVAAPYDAPNDWHFLTVVDVGAGTTDVATFLLRFNTTWPRAKVHLLPNSECSLAMAGDHVDQVLLNDLLGQVREHLNDSQYKEAEVHLRHRIRDLKEELFRDGEVEIELPGVSVCLERSDFLRLKELAGFRAALVDLLKKSFANIPKHFANRIHEKGGVKILFTGGGSSLPMVKSLVDQRYHASGVGFYAREGDANPEWLKHRSQDFQMIYPQLAVASGGASPDLPEH